MTEEERISRRALHVAIVCGLWPTNIGNAFLQLGARALMQEALPTSKVYLASVTPLWLMKYGYAIPGPLGTYPPKGEPQWRQWGRELIGRLLPRYDDSALKDFRPPDPAKALDIPSIGAFDLLVLPGMLLSEFIISLMGASLRTAKQAGAKVLFLGAGVEKYTTEEAAFVRRFLVELEPIGFVARDDRSFDLLAEAVSFAERGIDCGFFVADAFQPPHVRLPAYMVATFDKAAAPALDPGDRLLVYAHHSCFGPIPPHYWGTERTLISDLPEDYLTLYANAQEVHSSRVHACVAALAYGVPARLYSDTPRASLFDSVGASTITAKVVSIDAARLEGQKRAQVEWVRKRVSAAFAGVTDEQGIVR